MTYTSTKKRNVANLQLYGKSRASLVVPLKQNSARPSPTEGRAETCAGEGSQSSPALSLQRTTPRGLLPYLLGGGGLSLLGGPHSS